jgi:hypothetical protein
MNDSDFFGIKFAVPALFCFGRLVASLQSAGLMVNLCFLILSQWFYHFKEGVFITLRFCFAKADSKIELLPFFIKCFSCLNKTK